MYVCMNVGAHLPYRVEIRGQLAGKESVLPPSRVFRLDGRCLDLPSHLTSLLLCLNKLMSDSAGISVALMNHRLCSCEGCCGRQLPLGSPPCVLFLGSFDPGLPALRCAHFTIWTPDPVSNCENKDKVLCPLREAFTSQFL